MVAAAWAVLHYYGEEGYVRLNQEMLSTTAALRRGIEGIPGFRVLGDPIMYVVAFAAQDVDVMAVGDAMAERGWFLGRQPTTPPSLHVVLTPMHTAIVEEFLRDLRDVAGDVAGRRRLGKESSSYGSA
jgi:glutamate/tyrosine decarboxylase-like PLP-dependent enzyme